MISQSILNFLSSLYEQQSYSLVQEVSILNQHKKFLVRRDYLFLVHFHMVPQLLFLKENYPERFEVFSSLDKNPEIHAMVKEFI